MKTVQFLVTVGIPDALYEPLDTVSRETQFRFEQLLADSVEKGARLHLTAKWPSGCSFDVQAIVDGRRPE